MHRILVLHGPNLDSLGAREPDLYGHASLAEVDLRLKQLGAELECSLECLQSNHEGVLIDALHRSPDRADGVLLNPGGLTHTSVALRDAVLAAGIPVVEVHVTNPLARESFRQRSLISGAALGVVQGFGAESYLLGLRALAGHLARVRQT
ncbi:MAG TPA: type II 3-dehydroquinate dehydratase [Candidatus Limnocylindria bacterium]|nr:type II 3-dehydroquinate dehydratase [Candidatus Limnocylindria bacterium]